jgi:hypothetical protein
MGKYHKINKGSGIIRLRNVNQWVASGIQGRQVVDFPEVILTRDMLMGVTDNTRSNRYRLATDIHALNPYHAVPVSTLYPIGTTFPAQDTHYVQEVESDMQLLSMSTLPQQVTVYYVTPRYDTNNDPVTFWSNLHSDKSLTQVTATTAGTIGTPSVNAGFSSHLDVGNNPWSHKEFRKNWKMVGKHQVVLQPGDQNNIRLKLHYGTYLSQSSLERSRTQQFLANITVFPFIVGVAGLEGISASAGGESSEVAYGKCKIGMVHNQTLVFRAPPANRLDIERVYKGAVEATTEEEKHIEATDDVQITENL